MTSHDQARNSTSPNQQNASGNSGAEEQRRVLLSIAGFDPSSGAGVTADLKVFAAHGFYGMACVTALTVQSTLGVRAVEPVAGKTVAATLQTLAEDVAFAGIKIGMLATAEVCGVVGDFLDAHPQVPVVLDPVLRSSSGKDLLEAGGISILRERLLRRVNWITPNLDELAILTEREIAGREDLPGAAENLMRLARQLGNSGLNILATGGHLDRPDDYLLTSAGDSEWIPGQFVETKATHGTGCAFSSSLLCRIVAEDSAHSAARNAKDYVVAALRKAYPIGHGRGPMNHLFALDDPCER
jgi:hydroxymethylpyrimidine/phosphomethylpyrimidine kinase